MSTILLNNKINQFESGPATVKKVVADGKIVTVSFALSNGSTVRESYRLSKPEGLERFRAVVNAVLGKVPDQLEPEDLMNLPCLVNLEERPWTEDRMWMGVAEVLPCPCQEESKMKQPRMAKRVIPRPSTTNSVAKHFDDDMPD